MNGLKNLRINGLKDLREIGLKNLGISGLKDIILKPRHARDTDIEGLTKSREEVKIKIRKLVKEKEEIEFQIVQLQKTVEEENEEISGSPRQEKNWAEKPDKFDELKEKDKEENIDKIGIEAEVIEAKADSKRTVPEGKTVAENNKVVDFNNSASEEVEEIVFLRKEEKTEILDSILQENKEDRILEKSKTESKKTAPGIFGDSLIEDLLKSEDLYREEEQSFMKYIEESSAVDILKDLREVKGLLA
ncbi:MAG: hypothetical protein PHG79_04345 [Methanosarcina sp.]|jgi:hypothetical protein|nr:hypothetical protein [Methanosarcina sp.]MDD3872924.1 hypothetical protein [Methanosarcina sp.]MDD4522131.1 hypothetical protein [Methanosarcina sp.]HHV25000.1 hypothetical protein [Methanosarcina sp.]